MANINAKREAASLKNEMKMKLLVALPSFQNDVKKIRVEFGIPENGFGKNDKVYGDWFHKKFYSETHKILKSNKYTKAERTLKNARWEGKIMPDEYEKEKWNLLDQLPINAFTHRLESLQAKFRLPYNFITAQRGGVRWYIERGVILSPGNNWMITPDPLTRKETARWLSIQTFAPLSKQEVRDSVRLLKEIQAHYFPRSINIPLRERKRFERDLELVDELRVKRKGRPVKKEHLSGYLALLEKAGGLTEAIKKQHKHDIEVKYDRPTSKIVGRCVGISSQAVRQSLKRLNRDAKRLFGVGFE